MDGRRGRSSAAPVSSAAPKKKHLIEAAPFGRLDQMLSTVVQGRGVRGLCPLAKNRGSGGQRPPAKSKNFEISKNFEKTNINIF